MARLNALHLAMDKLNSKIERIRRMLSGGRNVDAVDDLAKYEFYREQALHALRWCFKVLELAVSAILAMQRIFWHNNDWKGVSLGCLHDLLAAQEHELEYEVQVQAIMNYLPQVLFE